MITAVIGAATLAIFLILLIVGCWYTKAKYRKAQRLERRNSIRQSLNSLRSVGTNGGFSELGYRRKAAQMVTSYNYISLLFNNVQKFQSTRSTDTLTKGSDYKKMVSNGSIDSMEKSTFNSSIEDNQSYDIFEAHNPNPAGFSTYSAASNGFQNPMMKTQQPYPKPQNNYETPSTFGLAYKNEGFRDNSTFASTANSTFPSRAESVHNNISEEMPIIHSPHDHPGDDTYTSDYYNTDTLPLNSTLGQSDSTLDLKRDIDIDIDENNRYYDTDKPQMNFLQELKSKMPQTSKEDLKMMPVAYGELPSPPEPPGTSRRSPDYYPNIPPSYTPDYNTLGIGVPDPYQDERPKSADVLGAGSSTNTTPGRTPKSRAKSEALLETNFDYYEEPEREQILNQPLSETNRSKSQPLETAM